MKTSTATYTWVSSSMIQFTEIATVIFRRPLSLSLSLSLSRNYWNVCEILDRIHNSHNSRHQSASLAERTFWFRCQVCNVYIPINFNLKQVNSVKPKKNILKAIYLHVACVHIDVPPHFLTALLRYVIVLQYFYGTVG